MAPAAGQAMKIAVLSPSLSRALGGIFEIERAIAVTQASAGCEVTAFGLHDVSSEEDRPRWGAVPVHLARPVGPAVFGYSAELRRMLLASDVDVVHLHSLWMYTSVLARSWSRRTGRPYLTTIHGMLEPWAIQNSGLKKRIAGMLYERAALRDAGCLHVNTEAELASLRALGVPGPYCIIPNGVFLPAQDLPGLPEESKLAALRREGAKIMLFLGRLHPKKNLPATLKAFAKVAKRHRKWHFAIVGWGSDEHRAALEAQAEEDGLGGRVHFLGPAFGDLKEATLAAADAFILASHSEGLPMAVLEAFAHAKPVLMTPMCNFQHGFDVGAAISVGVDADSIAIGLEALMSASDVERAAMGERGRALMERSYSWERVAGQLVDVYRWMVAGGPVPETVVF